MASTKAEKTKKPASKPAKFHKGQIVFDTNDKIYFKLTSNIRLDNSGGEEERLYSTHEGTLVDEFDLRALTPKEIEASK